MISNLTIRSNLIESLTKPSEIASETERMDAPLARISAHDLNELCEMNPFWPHYFDTRNLERQIDGLPTPEQKGQWISYLFHGDKTVSMRDGQRCSKPWLAMIESLLEQWASMEANLDDELAIECLCIFEAGLMCIDDQADSAATEFSNKVGAVTEAIENFLENRGVHQNERNDRLRSILGLSDQW